MGSGHGPHSKDKSNGATVSQVVAELKAAELSLREAKKRLARASTALHRIPTRELHANPQLWEYQEPIDEAQRAVTKLKLIVDKAIAIGPGSPSKSEREEPDDAVSYTGALCSVCRAPQTRDTDGETSCENSHAGAPPLEIEVLRQPDEVDPRKAAQDVLDEHDRKRPEARAPRTPKSF